MLSRRQQNFHTQASVEALEKPIAEVGRYIGMGGISRITGVGFVIAFSSLSVMEGLAQVVLHQDDFEDGKADGWNMGPGWEVEREDSNYVLSGTSFHRSYQNDFLVSLVMVFSFILLSARRKLF